MDKVSSQGSRSGEVTFLFSRVAVIRSCDKFLYNSALSDYYEKYFVRFYVWMYFYTIKSFLKNHLNAFISVFFISA